MTTTQQIEQAAAEWLMRREEPGWTDLQQDEFATWLDESWEHKAAFWRLEHGWREVDRIKSLGLDVSDLVPSWRKKVRRFWKPIAGLAIAASIGSVAFLGSMLAGPNTSQASNDLALFDTPVGKQENVQLADGSTVELNTSSIVRTSITSERREVWLDQGEAFFQVRHREGQPFIVHAGDRKITVLGTKFSVRLGEGVVKVSVLEGRVQVESANPNTIGGAAIVSGGGTAISESGNTLFIRGSDDRVERSLAWREGMLAFDQAPLSQVVSEFNRYSEKRIVIEDPQVANVVIGGTFRSDNSEGFLRLLRDAYGFQVTDVGTTVTISE